MRTTRLGFFALCCLLVGLTTVAAVAGAPPPTQLCGVCGTGDGYGSGIGGATDPGTLDVYVDDAGDSLWSARVPVTDAAAERYRTNETAFERAVDDAWASSYHAAEGDVGTVERGLDDDAVVVNYTVADVARPGVGDAWFLDYFARASDSSTRYTIVAERVSVHPPDGHEVTVRPPGGTIEDGAATWRGEGDGFSSRTYFTYGPEGGLVGAATGWATIAHETGSARLQHAAIGGLPPAAVLVGAAVAIGRVDGSTPVVGRLERRLDGFETKRLGLVVAAFGLIGAGVVLTYGRPRPTGAGAVAVVSAALGYAALGGLVPFVGRRLTLRRALAATLAAVALAIGLAAFLAGRPTRPTPIAFLLSAAAFLPLGVALERGDARWPAIALSLAGPFVLLVAVSVLTPSSIWSFVLGLLLVPAAAIATVAGYPLSILGSKLAAENGPDGTDRSR